MAVIRNIHEALNRAKGHHVNTEVKAVFRLNNGRTLSIKVLYIEWDAETDTLVMQCEPEENW